MKKLILLSLTILIAGLASAQIPTYQAYLMNDRQVSATVYEFDIYLRRTGATTLEVANVQVGLNFNTAIINGGTLTDSLVPGTSEFVSVQVPNTFTVDATNSILKIGPRTNPGAGSGTIISSSGNGTRLGRFRLKNTVPFGTVTPNLSWNFLGLPKYPTRLSAYADTGTGVKAIDVTVADSNKVNLNNPILNVSISGLKFNDLNGNGVKDGGEPGLQNWRIRLTRAGVQLDSTLTASDGSYTFTNLVATTYVVSEATQSGWIQTTSPSTYSVVISGGTSSTGNDFGNFQLGSVNGTKYNDLNGNGSKDGGDPGLQGWRIRLSKSGVQVDSTLTDVNGNYTFSGLTAGTYVVSEQLQSGWIQTSSPSTYSVDVTSGTVSNGNNFGNFQLGSISGMKYNDIDGNGSKGVSEPGLQNWRIRLTRSGVQVDSTLTDVNGNYSFGNLAAGTYVVSEQPQSGWAQTSSPSTFSIVVTSGTVSAGNNFGNFQLGSISGMKYNDLDGDGSKGVSEPGLQNWRIRLTRSGVQVDSTLTDVNGNYSFDNLTAGTYVVSEQLQSGWAQTSSPSTFSIVVTSGTVSAGNNFGNFQLGTVSGMKYNDLDGNGAKGVSEPGLQNWRIRLTKSGVQVDSTLTDVNGNYSFGNLTAGTYVVSEQLQSGWVQTSSPSTFSVGVTSGTVSSGNNFGNYQLGTISGMKYNDLNGDGSKGVSEPGLQNWRIRLTVSGVQVESTLTDVNGNYSFAGLSTGTYVVSEQLQSGWIQTSSPSTFTVGVTSGTVSTGNNFGNYQLGTISGLKFNDLDGNGSKGVSEPGLQNWRIRLTRSGVQVDSTLTDVNGNYSFAGLTTGSYVVSEQLQPGWIQTSSPSTFTIGVTSGTVSAGNNFGNFQLGTISGMKYNDQDGDGSKGVSEPGLQNWRIRLTRSGVQVDSLLTDVNGNYSFGNLTAGTYAVSEQLQSGWIQTSSPSTFTIGVTSGTVSAGNNFGNFQTGSVSGIKYHDYNKNGVKDGGEPGLQNWRIRLTKSGIQVDSALTDVNGNYSFATLTAGTYVVSEVQQSGWMQTSAPATYSINVVSGTASTGNNFGNFRLQLSLKALLEGFYDEGSGTMIPDSVRVELHNGSSPFAEADHDIVVLNPTGQATATFRAAANGTAYYVVLKHRNTIETWSNTTQTFSASALTYDFTTAASKAYGSNMIQKGAKWAVYSGDCAKDGLVDGLDMNVVDNNSSAFLFGYYVSDMNGDSLTDGADMNFVDNNSATFVNAITPENTPPPAAAELIKKVKKINKVYTSRETPTYEFMMANDKLVNSRSYEFDVYVRGISDTLVIANTQLGISYNDAVRHGGTLTFSMIPGSSEFISSQIPANFSVDTTTGVLRVAPRMNPSGGAGTVISRIANGTRLGRFRISNSVPFAAGTMDLSWNFAGAGKKYPSRISAYDGIARDMTAPSSFVTRLANPDLSGKGLKDNLPHVFALFENYPNPFNPTTTIRFTLPASSVVTLKVYDILGQEVASIMDMQKVDDFINEVTFNAQSLGSGLYFCRLTAETVPHAGDKSEPQRFVSVKKMLFVK